MGNNNYKLGSDFFYDFFRQKREEYFGLSNKKSPKYPYSISLCSINQSLYKRITLILLEL